MFVGRQTRDRNSRLPLKGWVIRPPAAQLSQPVTPLGWGRSAQHMAEQKAVLLPPGLTLPLTRVQPTAVLGKAYMKEREGETEQVRRVGKGEGRGNSCLVLT